jgi:hypothetical protein
MDSDEVAAVGGGFIGATGATWRTDTEVASAAAAGAEVTSDVDDDDSGAGEMIDGGGAGGCAAVCEGDGAGATG